MQCREKEPSLHTPRQVALEVASVEPRLNDSRPEQAYQARLAKLLRTPAAREGDPVGEDGGGPGVWKSTRGGWNGSPRGDTFVLPACRLICSRAHLAVSCVRGEKSLLARVSRHICVSHSLRKYWLTSPLGKASEMSLQNTLVLITVASLAAMSLGWGDRVYLPNDSHR